MMLVNNNISPLPFYDDISKQNHRKPYAFGQIYPLLVPTTLIPFQVVLPSDNPLISAVRLYNINTGKYIDITNSLIDNGLHISKTNNFNVLKYTALFPISEIKYEGLHYLAIDITNLGTIYSDIFSVVYDISKYLCIQYSNDYNLSFKNGIVDFSDGFTFKCYLDTLVGKPEYSFEEEVTERMGYSYIESQVSKKVYKFTFIAPEYLCDALRIIRMCKNKHITTENCDYDPITFSMDPKWQDQGDLASVECEFETDNIIASIGGYSAPKLEGDFNKDFNSDFKIS